MVQYFVVIVVKICNNVPIPKSRIGDVKITSRTWCPSVVTNGKLPPRGPALPNAGLLHTLQFLGIKGRTRSQFEISQERHA